MNFSLTKYVTGGGKGSKSSKSAYVHINIMCVCLCVCAHFHAYTCIYTCTCTLYVCVHVLILTFLRPSLRSVDRLSAQDVVSVRKVLEYIHGKMESKGKADADSGANGFEILCQDQVCLYKQMYTH